MSWRAALTIVEEVLVAQQLLRLLPVRAGRGVLGMQHDNICDLISFFLLTKIGHQPNSKTRETLRVPSIW